MSHPLLLHGQNLLITSQDTVTDPCASSHECWHSTNTTMRAPRTQVTQALACFATGTARRKPTLFSNAVHLKVLSCKPATGETLCGVSRDASRQLIAPSSKQASQQQLSTADLHPRDPSNSITSMHLYAVAPSSSALWSPYGNNILGNTPQHPKSALTVADSTVAIGLNGNANGGTGSDSFLYGSMAKQAEEAAAAAACEGCTNSMAVYDCRQLACGGIDQDNKVNGCPHGVP